MPTRREDVRLRVADGPPMVAGGVAALMPVEQRTFGPGATLPGVALRYGFFHGPGTWFHDGGDVARRVLAGRYPVLGSGAGRWSFVHLDDAVAATVRAIESDVVGAFNVCDDDPPRLRGADNARARQGARTDVQARALAVRE